MVSGRPGVRLSQNWNLILVPPSPMQTVGPSEPGWGSFWVRGQLFGVPVLRLWLPVLALSTCMLVYLTEQTHVDCPLSLHVCW